MINTVIAIELEAYLEHNGQIEAVHDQGQPVDEICIDPKRSCFWRCQAGPVPLTDQPRVLANFLADLQRICIHRGYAVASDPIPDKETEDD